MKTGRWSSVLGTKHDFIPRCVVHSTAPMCLSTSAWMSGPPKACPQRWPTGMTLRPESDQSLQYAGGQSSSDCVPHSRQSVGFPQCPHFCSQRVLHCLTGVSVTLSSELIVSSSSALSLGRTISWDLASVLGSS